jgi:hypothetical protein
MPAAPQRHLPTPEGAPSHRSLPARDACATPTAGGTALRSSRSASTRTGTTSSRASEDGSLVTEYGLLAVVAATIAGVVISWASNGALVTLFNALLRHARGLVGA